jgi:hypothetical protein
VFRKLRCDQPKDRLDVRLADISAGDRDLVPWNFQVSLRETFAISEVGAKIVVQRAFGECVVELDQVILGVPAEGRCIRATARTNPVAEPDEALPMRMGM